jgi:hypothetical protein
VSKNEYLSTPFIFGVNQNLADLSAYVSIECSPSTRVGQHLVQLPAQEFLWVQLQPSLMLIQAAAGAIWGFQAHAEDCENVHGNQRR